MDPVDIVYTYDIDEAFCLEVLVDLHEDRCS